MSRISHSRLCQEQSHFGQRWDFVSSEEARMILRRFIVPLALAAPLTAASAAEFYVVQDTATKRCQVVEQKPSSITAVIVGEGKVYANRIEADNAMKSVEVCRSGDTGAGGQTGEQPK
jgi:hypothetical protein